MKLINLRTQKLTEAELSLIENALLFAVDGFLELGSGVLDDQALAELRAFEWPEEIFEVPFIVVPNGLAGGLLAAEVQAKRKYPELPRVVNLLGDTVVIRDFNPVRIAWTQQVVTTVPQVFSLRHDNCR